MRNKNLFFLFFILVTVSLILCGCSETEQETADGGELVVFNYGDYIDKDVLDLFEKETGITVKYEEYLTPEDMHTKFGAGGICYDVICTSDYMIEKMIQAGELTPIDQSMPNLKNIDEKYLKLCNSFDPGNVYAVPYHWGTIGILYNTSMVDEPVESWSILWDEKYKSQIVMQNSMRDAFVVPLKLLGYSMNTTDKNELLEAQQLLFNQKEILMAYLVDEIRDIMIAGDAALAVIYSGDATAAMESNEDLRYAVPEEGTNAWFDCWVIPETAKHKEEAQMFLDFLCRPDIALMNFEYIYYGTPNKEVIKMLDEETLSDESIFPRDEILEKCEVYQYLGTEMDQFYNQMWKELKSY